MNQVIFIKDGKEGPFTIHEMGGVFIPVSHCHPLLDLYGPYNSKEDCINSLLEIFGEENVVVRNYRNPSIRAFAIFNFLTGAILGKGKSVYSKIRFQWFLGIGFHKQNSKKSIKHPISNYQFLLPFLKIEIGQYEHGNILPSS